MEQFQGRLYVLANSDVVLLSWQAKLHQLRPIADNVQALFEVATDPDSGPDEEFCTWYDLERQVAEFLSLAEEMARGLGSDVPAMVVGRHHGRRIPTLGEVADLIDRLKSYDLTPVIQRQAICQVSRTGAPRPVFEEIFIAIGELNRLFAPDIDLIADRTLFQYLTKMLDRLVLSWLAKTGAESIRGDFSVNLNLSTIASADFASFEASLDRSVRERMVVEMQKADAFADLALYDLVRDVLRERGYPICLDGLNHFDIVQAEGKRFDADMIKIRWTPETPFAGDGQAADAIRRLAREAGGGRVILCRCGSSDAVTFGQSLGLFLFQGWYVDTELSRLRTAEASNS
jgi:EAL domain-containing protein (putative c-di-GMP-specific phosphodiesterase class I)